MSQGTTRRTTSGNIRFAASLVLGASAALLATSTLSGCASQSDSSITLPPQNVAEWSMPLDEFVPNESNIRDYAEALLIAPCMTESGYRYEVPWQPTDRGFGLSFSSSGQRLFNVALAEQFGYHTAPNEWENKGAWRQFGEQLNETGESTVGFDDKLVSCRDSARAEIPVPSDEVLYYAAEASAQSYDEALLRSEVQETAEIWKQCMRGTGYSDLTAHPDLMPTDDLAEDWQIASPGTLPAADEIKMAVADANCSEQSGWTRAVYDAQWEWQADFVSKNSDKLLSIRDDIQSSRSKLLEAISENAPTRG